MKISDAPVIVTDLDGVLRHFDAGLFERLDRDYGLESGTAYRAILGHPHLDQVIRGRSDHETWQAHAKTFLCRRGLAREKAESLVHAWLESRAEPDLEVVAELRRARSRGADVFVFTNGTDRVREEIRDLGLDEFTGPAGTHLINSYDLHCIKPELLAFARAHRVIEASLGNTVAPEDVFFVDDRWMNAEAARELGWRSEVYTRHPAH